LPGLAANSLATGASDLVSPRTGRRWSGGTFRSRGYSLTAPGLDFHRLGKPAIATRRCPWSGKPAVAIGRPEHPQDPIGIAQRRLPTPCGNRHTQHKNPTEHRRTHVRDKARIRGQLPQVADAHPLQEGLIRQPARSAQDADSAPLRQVSDLPDTPARMTRCKGNPLRFAVREAVDPFPSTNRLCPFCNRNAAVKPP